MHLSDEQQAAFEDQGFLILPDLFSAQEVGIIRQAMTEVFAEEHPGNIRESGGQVVRTAMGLHLRHPVFERLVRHPKLVNPARQLRGSELYVQQVKINVKAAFDGDQWQWHYDFATHRGDDGVPEPLPLNLHIFLDDVTPFNGPLYFLPGSHKDGPAPAWHDTTSTSYPLWVVERDTVARHAEARGIVSATGAAGTGLIFGDLLVHGSPPNMSPWDRAIFSLILNPVSNAYTREERPDYKHHRDLTPVLPLAETCLLEVG